tara:strand:- start:57 stop:521 length:465 start_codon:yes stop_codon:yes gene_type:complete
MNKYKLIHHAPYAPGLRYFGLGPNFIPRSGLKELKILFNKNTFWARNRSIASLKKMLSNSNVVISVWNRKNLIGFGRATSDESYRAVLWDIVVDKDYQVNGIGMEIIQSILKSRMISKVEKVYLMTTNSQDFYINNGFKLSEKQKLMYLSINNS